MSNLTTFIRANLEPILAEWEVFARELPGTETMDIAALRDHARGMLQVIASDLETPQTSQEQSEKAAGRSDASGERRRSMLTRAQTPAQEHGAGRAESGFTVSQMVAEFRALRASVIHLWTAQQTQATTADLQDMIRFNEGIDQAIAESITTYAREVNATRDRFLAILGHDLRTPLGAIITSAEFMREVAPLPEPHLSLVTRIDQSARRMNQMVTDLLEFTRTRFGDSIPVVPADMDLESVMKDVASEIRATNASVTINLSVDGNVRGHWDRARLSQAFVNLLSNAVHHGDSTRPISLNAARAGNEVLVRFHNEGTAIPADEIEHLFDAMKESNRGGAGDRRHLGLGLYIVDQIVKAHGGKIEVDSTSAGGTTFMMRLPASAKSQRDSAVAVS
jgi:signal transduction histidine kinase